jgi:hypothetical protein
VCYHVLSFIGARRELIWFRSYIFRHLYIPGSFLKLTGRRFSSCPTSCLVSVYLFLRIMFFSALVAGLLVLSAEAIKLTTTDAAYTVDAESTNPFTFTVQRSSCDVTSIKYIGSEVQYQSTASHISSGLGTATVSATSITCKYTLESFWVHQTAGPKLSFQIIYSETANARYRWRDAVCQNHLRNINLNTLLRDSRWR